MLFSPEAHRVAARRSSEGDAIPSQKTSRAHARGEVTAATSRCYRKGSQITQKETGEILPHLKCFHKLHCTKALGSGITPKAGIYDDAIQHVIYHE